MGQIRKQEYVFVTNNASDFKKLFGQEQIHAGLIIIVPSTSPEIQRALFEAALEEIKNNETINSVVEVRLQKDRIVIETFELSKKHK